jgi:hypothetical protein
VYTCARTLSISLDLGRSLHHTPSLPLSLSLFRSPSVLVSRSVTQTEARPGLKVEDSARTLCCFSASVSLFFLAPLYQVSISFSAFVPPFPHLPFLCIQFFVFITSAVVEVLVCIRSFNLHVQGGARPLRLTPPASFAAGDHAMPASRSAILQPEHFIRPRRRSVRCCNFA